MPERSVLLGLLGEHIDGSLTPAMLEAEGRQQGLPLVYRTLDPGSMGLQRPDWPGLVRTAAQFGYDGLNVTHPAKQAVLTSMDMLSDDATLLGAVNTVLLRGGSVRGENTDHLGFTAALRAADVDPAAGPVVQFGAGGAGAAIAYALLRGGVPRLHVVDVRRESALALIDRLSVAFDASRMVATTPAEAPAVLRGASGLVNCTPIGMDDVSHDSPVDVNALHPGLWVGDAIYRPLRTTLVRDAEALGCTAFGGAAMVVGQAEASFELFTGRRATPGVMDEAFQQGARSLAL